MSFIDEIIPMFSNVQRDAENALFGYYNVEKHNLLFKTFPVQVFYEEDKKTCRMLSYVKPEVKAPKSEILELCNILNASDSHGFVKYYVDNESGVIASTSFIAIPETITYSVLIPLTLLRLAFAIEKSWKEFYELEHR